MHLPAVGDRLPRQGNRATRALGRLMLRLSRWRIEGTIPNREKLLAIAAPHTTGWDFVIAMVTLLALGVRISWLGVDWLFRYPFMRAIGGIPVDRAASGGLVPQAVAKFRSRPQFVLGLSPEGSRKRVVPWRTGFYHIAVGAGVPIVLVALDPQKRRIQIGPTIEPSGDYEADMTATIRPFYAELAERYADRFGF